MSELNNADAEIMRLATQADDAPEADAAKVENYKRSTAVEEAAKEPLELGSEEAPEATPEQVEEDEEKKKGRSHSLTSRVNQLTARLRQTERELAEERAAKAGGQPTAAPTVSDLEAKKPDPQNFEFGTADPDYAEALTDWKLDLRDAKGREARGETEEQKAATAQRSEISGKLADGMANIEKTGPEKYDDFEAKIDAAVEARGGEPLPPLVSVGIAVSPAGADIAYRLATDDAATQRIEALAQTNPQQAAIAFGELEGEYLSDDSDTDLNPADPLDLARMIGRERARRKGLNKGTVVELKTTKMADPPEKRARGAAGQFEVGDDTDDFRSFERKIMGGNR